MKFLELTILTNTNTSLILEELLLAVGAEGTSTEDPDHLDRLLDDGFGIIKPDQGAVYSTDQAIVKAYFPSDTDTNAIEIALQESLRAMQVKPVHCTWQEQTITTQDYMHIEPIMLTPKLVVLPAYEATQPSYDLTLDATVKPIYIEPGLSFGTGDHPTTRLAANQLHYALAQVPQVQRSVFDVGTGSGILALAAKALGATQVTAFDLDAQATLHARQNIALNPHLEPITVQENNLLEHISSTVHIVVANIVAPILEKLITQALNVLVKSGFLILSGILKEESSHLEQLCQAAGFSLVRKLEEEDWISLLVQKNQ